MLVGESPRHPDYDPMRDELHARWTAYLAGAPGNSADWAVQALACYRDQITRRGLQLLVWAVGHEPDRPTVLAAHDAWTRDVTRYQQDPSGWERAYWRAYVLRIAAENPSFALRVVAAMRGDPLTDDDADTLAATIRAEADDPGDG